MTTRAQSQPAFAAAGRLRLAALLSVFAALPACFPLEMDDGYEPYDPGPPECAADADCADEDTDDDRCTVAECQGGQCQVVPSNDETCECWDYSPCPDPGGACAEVACEDHQCVVTVFPAGPAPDQEPGDCAEVLCDGETPDGELVALGDDVPPQETGDCAIASCNGVTPEPDSTQDPLDLPPDKQCNTGYCDDFGPAYTPHPDGTECAGGSGFCFRGDCMTTCNPTNPSACGDEGLAEPANDSGETPTQYTGAPGACGFLDASDADWYTFYAKDDDFVTDILWVHAWSTAASIEVCVYVKCGDGSNPGGGCGNKLSGPNGSLGCCWSGASQGFAQSWDLDCATNEDSGTAYVSVRTPGGDTCETYAVDMSY